VIAFELPARHVDDVTRLVRALGRHRYVAGRLHLVHAFVFDAVRAAGTPEPLLGDAIAWAERVLKDPTIEIDSRDERLWRSATEEEIAVALDTFWRPGPRADQAHDKLIDRLVACGLELGAHSPFDEGAEADMHPVLVDAGWELLPLAALDKERHKGAVSAFGEAITFDVARFEEENAYEPVVHLEELPALGAVELLRGVGGDGLLARPLVIWAEGSETYHDYVVRGVIRAAKLES
jgi:hypothetical protein